MSFLLNGGLLLLILPGMLAGYGRSSSIREDKHQKMKREDKHPCDRKCGKKSMDCEYEFVLEHYMTLSTACYNCPFNLEDCFRPNCISADGVSRSVVVANRQIPGPAIRVCEDDTIIVKAVSNLQPETTTLHWHGVHQRDGSAFMDGAPMITQCPILPGTNFTYKFKASPAGTRFWHSHSGFQRPEGLVGSLVIVKRDEEEENKDLYDYDLPEHTITIMDWMNESTTVRFTKHNYQGIFAGDGSTQEIPESILINGMGQFQKVRDVKTSDQEYTPRAVFEVSKDKRYRFRVIHGGSFTCPVLFSIDNHKLTVIAADGHSVEPYLVDAFVLSPAERIDFILETHSTPCHNYWIKTKGLVDCKDKEVRQAAILRYNGASNNDPSGSTGYEAMSRTGKVLNPINEPPSMDQIPITWLNSIETTKSVRGKPDEQFFISFHTTSDDSPSFIFHDPEFNPLGGTTPYDAPQWNYISHKIPPCPLLHQFKDVPKKMFCNSENIKKDCKKEFCECIHVLEVDYKDLVEIVLVDEEESDDSAHPTHLHGHSFRVVAMEKFSSRITVDDVKKMDKHGKINRKLDNAVLKDTVNVPNKGFTIIRFVADNPGVWLMHCHLDFHSEKGMALVIKVGDEDHFPKVPKSFPRCCGYHDDDDDY